jgi:hypothetical protein
MIGPLSSCDPLTGFLIEKEMPETGERFPTGTANFLAILYFNEMIGGDES